jgi:hypothetical protein
MNELPTVQTIAQLKEVTMRKLIWTIAAFCIIGGGTIGFIGAVIAGLAHERDSGAVLCDVARHKRHPSGSTWKNHRSHSLTGIDRTAFVNEPETQSFVGNNHIL